MNRTTAVVVAVFVLLSVSACLLEDATDLPPPVSATVSPPGAPLDETWALGMAP